MDAELKKELRWIYRALLKVDTEDDPMIGDKITESELSSEYPLFYAIMKLDFVISNYGKNNKVFIDEFNKDFEEDD